jgi:(S)-3,5-dihydroxyphenylglycine transaminase
MDAFFVGAGGRHQLRLSSSYLPPGDVADGIARLAAFITAEAGRLTAPAGLRR